MESTIRIKNLIGISKNNGHDTVVLCDHNVLFGMPEFLEECKNANIKGLVGLEVDILYEDNLSNMALIAKNSQGLKEIMQISSYICKNKQPINLDNLLHRINDCVLIVYGEGGLIDSDLINNNQEEVIRKLKYIKDYNSDFYVGLSYMEASLWKEKNNILKKICNDLDIKTVALNKNYYLKEEDWIYYKALRGIYENKTIHDSSLTSLKGRYFLSEAEMRNIYDECDIENTNEINKKCYGNYVFEKANLPCPKYVGDNDPKKYLRKLCEVGLAKRLNNRVSNIYKQRLDYELDVICEKNFENYFLIVFDIVRQAKNNMNIKVGPGRGSANGSLVAYSLGITETDPIKYNTLFERFLNRERVSMPDIDIDIERSRRNELIDYLKESYGEDAVMTAVVFSYYRAKSSIIDAGRYLDYPSTLVNRVISRIPKHALDEEWSLKDIINTNNEFKTFIESDNRYLELIKYAYNIENLLTSYKRHVSAIIISDRTIEDIIPIIKDGDVFETQVSGDYLEDYGIIKFDLLSSVVMENINNIEKAIKKDAPGFNLSNISLEDKNVYKVLSGGNSLGIFQLESNLQKSLLRQVKPSSFNELVTLMGLMRPAAKDSIPLYIHNKNNKNAIKYVNEDLKNILEETYGVMVFQDQAMLSFASIADYTIYEADRLRSAFKKQDDKYLNNLREEFINRATKNNYSKEISEQYFENIKNFATYGFNKAHAVAYALIAYRIAYLKVNYPLYFYKEKLNSCLGDHEKTFELILESKINNVRLISPNINISHTYYEIKNDALLVPLTAIKNVSSDLSDLIIEERNKNGKFNSLFNFVGRIHYQHKLSEDIIHNIISSGSFDNFSTNRETMHSSVDDAISYAELIQVNNNGEKSINMNLVSEPIPINMVINKKESLQNEIDVLGFNVSALPITEIRKKHNISLPLIADIKNIFNQNIKGFGCVDKIEAKNIKGYDVYNIMIHDESGSIILSLWKDKYEKYAKELQIGSYIRFNGKIKRENIIYGEIDLIINESE